MSTIAKYTDLYDEMYAKSHPEEENRPYITKSSFLLKGFDKVCKDIVKDRSLPETDSYKLLCRIYELEISPKHSTPILGYADVYVDEKNWFYAHIELHEDFLDNEGLYDDLRVCANKISSSLSRLSRCHII